MQLSVIITAFNSGSLIAEAVNSILEENLECSYEIVVVDDGSSDPASLECLRHLKPHAAVRLIAQSENRGVQLARNAGLHAARGEFVILLDGDDRLESASRAYPDLAIEQLQNPAVAFVHTLSRMFGAFEGYTISAYPVTESQVVRKHHVPTSICFRRSDFLAGATYDPAILKWQDWAFAATLLATRWRRGAGTQIGFVPGANHKYRVHDLCPRISATNVDEFAMTLAVVRAHLDYFRDRLHLSADAQTLARAVVNAKPDRLSDLLHVARYDPRIAEDIRREREFELVSPFLALGIP